MRLAVDTQREVLEATGGTCRSPVGALAQVAGEEVQVLAAAVTADGATYHSVVLRGALGEAPRLAAEAGQELLAHVPLEPPP